MQNNEQEESAQGSEPPYFLSFRMEEEKADEERARLRRPNNPINLVEATLTPHSFRHPFVTLLDRAGVDLLKARKILRHSEYQTTADAMAAWKSRYGKPQKVRAGPVIRFPRTGS